MPRVICRCGQKLSVPVNGPERVLCPTCSAKIRVRRQPAAVADSGAGGDGFVRFPCPCGRRLKVRAGELVGVGQAGKCPDCGRVVPVPAEAVPTGADPETPTAELSPADLAALEQWSQAHLARGDRPAATVATATAGRPPQDTAGTTVDLPQTAVASLDPALAAAAPPPVRIEMGLRVCPRCGRPVHLNATTCRDCGAAVPKR